MILNEVRGARADIKQLALVVSGDGAKVPGLVRKIDRLRWQMRIVLALGVLLFTEDHSDVRAGKKAVEAVVSQASTATAIHRFE